jgi:hypothetical protein
MKKKDAPHAHTVKKVALYMNQEPYTPNNGENSENQNDLYTNPYAMPEKKPGNPFAVASLVLAIISLVCCCFSSISLICAVLAIVFAIIGRRRAGYFDGMCTAGLVCGIIAAALAAFSIISAILNPVDEAMLEEYMKMLEELMKEMEAGEQGAAMLWFLK